MKFSEIPQRMRNGAYEVNYGLTDLVSRIERWISDDYYQLQLNPDFQRGHVWTKKQQVAYVEYFLQGGRSGMVIYLNCPFWQNHGETETEYRDFVVVDGLQRLTALMGFMQNKVRAFGLLYRQFEGELHNDNFRINVNNLQTKAQVLQWYYEMNSGGTPHTKNELAKVLTLLENEKNA